MVSCAAERQSVRTSERPNVRTSEPSTKACVPNLKRMNRGVGHRTKVAGGGGWTPVSHLESVICTAIPNLLVLGIAFGDVSVPMHRTVHSIDGAAAPALRPNDAPKRAHRR